MKKFRAILQLVVDLIFIFGEQNLGFFGLVKKNLTKISLFNENCIFNNCDELLSMKRVKKKKLRIYKFLI